MIYTKPRGISNGLQIIATSIKWSTKNYYATTWSSTKRHELNKGLLLFGSIID